MTELKKPKERTPAGFASLLREEITNRKYRTNPNKSAAIEARVSPAAIGLMLNAAFPKKAPEGASLFHQRRIKDGAVYSLTRVCDVFGFDLDACLHALALPKDEVVIERSRGVLVSDKLRARPFVTAGIITLDKEGLDMLLKQVELLGPLPLELTLRLLEQFQQRKEP